MLRGASFPWNTRTQGPPRISTLDAHALPVCESSRTTRSTTANRPLGWSFTSHRCSARRSRAGFEAALSELSVSYFDFVAVAYSSVRGLLPRGQGTPIRGTVIELERNKHLVYTRGYIPFLKLYPGMRIPTPLLVVHDGGSGAVRDIVEELVALTRMNWNSRRFRVRRTDHPQVLASDRAHPLGAADGHRGRAPLQVLHVKPRQRAEPQESSCPTTRRRWASQTVCLSSHRRQERYEVDYLAKKFARLPSPLVKKVIQQEGPKRTDVEKYLHKMKK